MSRIRVNINQTNLNKYLYGETPGGVKALMRRQLRQILNRARKLCPVQEGTLRASLESELKITTGALKGRVGSSLFYAIYVHEGTGIYAGRGLIRPKQLLAKNPKPLKSGRPSKRRSALAFTMGGAEVVVAYVRGQRPNPFLVKALKEQVATW